MEAGPVSNEEWALVLKRRLGDSVRFKLLSVDWGIKSGEMAGFQGDHLFVKLLVSVDGKQSQELNFFVKTIPRVSTFRTEFITNTITYQKEIGVFSAIIEEFRKYGLISREFPWAPECYYTRPDLLVMENLISDGFHMPGKLTYMDFPHCQIVLLTLARFHATSIIYEEKINLKSERKYTLKELYPSTIIEGMYTQDIKNKQGLSMQLCASGLLSIIRIMDKYGIKSTYFNKISESIHDKCDMIYEYVQASSKYRNVLCHGDLWANNLLFRYATNSDIPEEVRMVDYQMVRYAPPALDVMAFLHLVTSREFRRTHLEALLSLYHAQLLRELDRHDMKVNVLPWEEFRESCQFYAQAARIIAPYAHNFVLMPEELIADTLSKQENFEKFMFRSRDDLVVKAFKESDCYRERLTDDLEELVEYVVLGQASDYAHKC